jgi:DNA polymerase III alpha subunit
MSKNEADGHTVIAQIEKEMRSRGFTLLPPHLVKSSIDFTIVDDKSIRFGLSMIRGVSDKSVSKLDAFRIDVVKSGDDFKKTVSKFQIFQAIKNAGLNIGIGSALIQAGCIEGYGESRSRLVLELCTWNLLTDKEKAICITLSGKPEINHDVLKAIIYLRDNKDEKGKLLFSRATRFDTIKKKYLKYKEIWEMNRRNERLANYFYERTILGYSYSETLRGIFGEEVDGLMSVADAEAAKQEDKVRLIGFVKEPIKSKSKAGNDMFRFTLTDETGEISIRFFNKTIDQIFVANGRLPEEMDMVIVKGVKKEGSCIFAQEIGVQTAKIYMKLSELKEAGEKTETGLAETPAAMSSAPAA